MSLRKSQGLLREMGFCGTEQVEKLPIGPIPNVSLKKYIWTNYDESQQSNEATSHLLKQLTKLTNKLKESPIFGVTNGFKLIDMSSSYNKMSFKCKNSRYNGKI